MGETSWKHTCIVLKSLLIRIASVGLCMAACSRISQLTSAAAGLSSDLGILLLVSELNGLQYLKSLVCRELIQAVLCFALVFPVLKMLLHAVRAEVVSLVFFLCQVIFCIDSVKSRILSTSMEKRAFERNDVILLEEGILIPLKIENSGACGNIAAVVGLIAMVSRVGSWADAVVLQTAGLVLYLFLPGFLESRSVHIIPLKIFLFFGSFFIFMFISDKTMFTAFSIIALAIAASISLLAMLLE